MESFIVKCMLMQVIYYRGRSKWVLIRIYGIFLAGQP